jgi:hypothetical protein
MKHFQCDAWWEFSVKAAGSFGYHCHESCKWQYKVHEIISFSSVYEFEGRNLNNVMYVYGNSHIATLTNASALSPWHTCTLNQNKSAFFTCEPITYLSLAFRVLCLWPLCCFRESASWHFPYAAQFWSACLCLIFCKFLLVAADF